MAGQRALLVVLDFRDARLATWIDGCAENGGLEEVTSIDTEMTMDPGEEKDDLGDYAKKFGAPKLQARVFVRVFRKS
jgi:hypothetical protein